jgi:hypothetical protein
VKIGCLPNTPSVKHKTNRRLFFGNERLFVYVLNGSILPAWRGVKSRTVFLMALPISYHIELECEA